MLFEMYRHFLIMMEFCRNFLKNLFKEIAENDFLLKQYSMSCILEIVQKFLVYFTIIRFLSVFALSIYIVVLSTILYTLYF